MNSKSDSEGSCHPLRECNKLHLLEDGAVVVGGVEDNSYLIPCTPREQAEYAQECLERARASETEYADEHRGDGCPSP